MKALQCAAGQRERGDERRPAWTSLLLNNMRASAEPGRAEPQGRWGLVQRKGEGCPAQPSQYPPPPHPTPTPGTLHASAPLTPSALTTHPPPLASSRPANSRAPGLAERQPAAADLWRRGRSLLRPGRAHGNEAHSADPGHRAAVLLATVGESAGQRR